MARPVEAMRPDGSILVKDVRSFEVQVVKCAQALDHQVVEPADFLVGQVNVGWRVPCGLEYVVRARIIEFLMRSLIRCPG